MISFTNHFWEVLKVMLSFKRKKKLHFYPMVIIDTQNSNTFCHLLYLLYLACYTLKCDGNAGFDYNKEI